MIKKHFVFFIFLLLASSLHSQDLSIDSLKSELHKNYPDSTKVKTLIDIGFRYLFINRDSALYYYDKALSLAKAQGMGSDELYVRLQIARALQDADNYAESLRLSLEVKDAAEKMGDSVNLWYAVRLIGWLYEEIGDDMKRLRYSRDLMTLTEKYPRIPKYFTFYEMSLRYLGSYFLDHNMLDSAAYYLSQSYSLAKSMGENAKLAFNTGDWGRYYLKMAQYDSALIYLQLSTDFSIKVSRFDVIIKNRLDMASIYLLKNKLDSALNNARSALKEAQSIPDSLNMIRAARVVVNAFDKAGQLDSAYYYLKYSQELQDHVSLQSKLNTVNNLIFNDALYRQQLANQKAQVEEKYRYNQRIYISLGSAFFLFMVSVLLFRNMRQKRKDAARIQQSYDQLKSAQAQLVQSEKMASLGELTAGIAHEIQNPLNFVNNFSEVNKELIEEAKSEIEKGNLNEAKSLLNDLQENQEKINQHGKRADGIVKGMLQHSRGSSEKKELTNINQLCDEYLRLSYHGLRAKDKTFNAKFESDFDPSIPKINVVPQDIGRVILNLLNNAFYAVSKVENALVTVTTKNLGDKIEIRIKDNGSGIPESIKEKIFQPFFTTKPAGSGTGLGLSLAYDIITKVHEGNLKVNSKEGEGSEFIIIIPIKTVGL